MKLIGITGGIGAGKSRVLSWLEENTDCRILLSDEAAHRVKEPGQPCYDRLVTLLGKDILRPDGVIDKMKMAEKIFSDDRILSAANAVIHPAVKTYILNEIENERAAGIHNWFFLEAALLIEEGYDKIMDELWYVYASDSVRRARLKLSRGYTDEKIDRIFASQLSDAEFRAHCKVVIDNGGSLSDTYMQMNKILKSCAETR